MPQPNALPHNLAVELEYNAARANTRLNRRLRQRVLSERGWTLLRGERDPDFRPPPIQLTGFLKLSLDP